MARNSFGVPSIGAEHNGKYKELQADKDGNLKIAGEFALPSDGFEVNIPTFKTKLVEVINIDLNVINENIIINKEYDYIAIPINDGVLRLTIDSMTLTIDTKLGFEVNSNRLIISSNATTNGKAEIWLFKEV